MTARSSLPALSTESACLTVGEVRVELRREARGRAARGVGVVRQQAGHGGYADIEILLLQRMYPQLAADSQKRLRTP